MIQTTFIVTGIPIGFTYPKFLREPMARLFCERRTTAAPNWRFHLEVEKRTFQRFRPARVVVSGEKRAVIRAFSVGPRGLSSAVATAIAVMLARNNGFLVHAAFFIGVRGGAIFVGPSGAGKTTLSRNAKGVTVVSDEMCAVRKVRGVWRAFGLPVFNKDMSVCPDCEARLTDVFLISKARSNRIAQMRIQDAMKRFSAELYVPFSSQHQRQGLFLSFLEFITHMRVRELRFKRDCDPGKLLG